MYVTVTANSTVSSVRHVRVPTTGPTFFIDSGEQLSKFADDAAGDNGGKNDDAPKLVRLLIISR